MVDIVDANGLRCGLPIDIAERVEKVALSRLAEHCGFLYRQAFAARFPSVLATCSGLSTSRLM